MEKVSVIVPVYNAEGYLRRCVASILGQTYPALEVLLIDDGSADGSGAICDAFSAEDSRVRVIHKANGGVQTAVLAGIAQASGGYTVFSDSDDWLCEDLVQVLCGQLEEHGADGVRCGFLRHEFGAVNRAGAAASRAYTKSEIEQEILEPFFESRGEFLDSWSNSRCGKLYKTGLLRRAARGCNPALAIGEDVDLNLRYLSECDKIYVMSGYFGYCYNNREDSVTHRYSERIPGQYALFAAELRSLALAQGRHGKALDAMGDRLFGEAFFWAVNSGYPAGVIAGHVREILGHIHDTQPLRRDVGRLNFYVRACLGMVLNGRVGAGVYLYRLIYHAGRLLKPGGRAANG